MPLDRTHVTVASRVMLPTYPLFFTAFGLTLLLTPRPVMQATPSFRYAANIMPLHTWGTLLVAVALLQTVALLINRREWFMGSLGVALASMLVWTAVFTLAAIYGGAPWSAPVWPGFVAIGCWASLRSLSTREV